MTPSAYQSLRPVISTDAPRSKIAPPACPRQSRRPPQRRRNPPRPLRNPSPSHPNPPRPPRHRNRPRRRQPPSLSLKSPHRPNRRLCAPRCPTHPSNPHPNRANSSRRPEKVDSKPAEEPTKSTAKIEDDSKLLELKDPSEKPKPKEKPAEAKPKADAPKQETAKKTQTAKLDLTPPAVFQAPVGGGGAGLQRPAGITRSGENDDFARGVIRALQTTMPQLRNTFGRVTVRIELNMNGNLVRTTVLKPSNVAGLDQSVVFATQQSSFPFPPRNAVPADLVFFVTYIYR